MKDATAIVWKKPNTSIGVRPSDGSPNRVSNVPGITILPARKFDFGSGRMVVEHAGDDSNPPVALWPASHWSTEGKVGILQGTLPIMEANQIKKMKDGWEAASTLTPDAHLGMCQSGRVATLRREIVRRTDGTRYR